MPSYITLIRVAGNKTNELKKALKDISEKPSGSVKVLGTWTSFGQYDGVCALTADNEEDGMDFITESLRGIEGVVSTETLVTVPQARFTPGKQ